MQQFENVPTAEQFREQLIKEVEELKYALEAADLNDAGGVGVPASIARTIIHRLQSRSTLIGAIRVNCNESEEHINRHNTRESNRDVTGLTQFSGNKTETDEEGFVSDAETTPE